MPWDDETMQKLIKLVQRAKSTPVYCKEEQDC